MQNVNLLLKQAVIWKWPEGFRVQCWGLADSLLLIYYGYKYFYYKLVKHEELGIKHDHIVFLHHSSFVGFVKHFSISIHKATLSVWIIFEMNTKIHHLNLTWNNRLTLLILHQVATPDSSDTVTDVDHTAKLVYEEGKCHWPFLSSLPHQFFNIFNILKPHHCWVSRTLE